MDLSVITGLGAEEYPGFPADVCPEELPDPSRLHNLLADALKRDAALYEAHRTGRTKSGVSFAKCIKMGLDNLRAWEVLAVDVAKAQRQLSRAWEVFATNVGEAHRQPLRAWEMLAVDDAEAQRQLPWAAAEQR